MAGPYHRTFYPLEEAAEILGLTSAKLLRDALAGELTPTLKGAASDSKLTREFLEMALERISSGGRPNSKLGLLPEEFERYAATVNITQPETRQVKGGRWPWGEYETKWMRIQAEAVQKFWVLYVPGEQDTAPDIKQIMKWLKTKGLSLTLAKSMATIIRADDVPRGRRPKPK